MDDGGLACVPPNHSCASDDCCPGLVCQSEVCQFEGLDSGVGEGGMGEGGWHDWAACIQAGEACGPSIGSNCCSGLTCKKETPSDPNPTCLP
ncbi:MAG: hypothetical protein ACOC1F_08545 [Myxococcota bacterium]